MSDVRDSAQIERHIERLQRRRLLLLSISAIAFLTWISANAWPVFVPLRRDISDRVCTVAFLIWIGSLAGMLSGYGGMMHQQIVRAALNDELTLAHRRTSLILGYWSLLGALAVIYVWSSFAQVDTRSAVALLLGAAVAVPILSFVVLEHQSDRDD